MDEETGEDAVAAEAEGQDKLLPMRLSPFAPPDPVAEGRTAERLRQMTAAQLRLRRARIDKRLNELGLTVGEPSLEIPSVRGTGLVDIDRILRKVDSLDMARDQARMEREAEGKSPLFGAIDLGWLTDAFRFREIRARRALLVSELGLALCAADLRQIEEYAPHVRRLLQEHVNTARRIDELFVEMRLLEDEFERRRREGGTEEEPKEIDTLISKALDSVDDVGSKAVDTIAELGKSAAKTAVTGGGQAVWGIVRESAKGAIALGSRTIANLGSEGDDELAGPAEPDLELVRPPAPRQLPPPRRSPDPAIPELIRELARLRQEGILTQEEFQAKKKDLLGRL